MKLAMTEERRERMENDLGRDDIRRLVRRIALPGMLAQFVSVLYSIVDRMYIGHIPEVGELALAGVGICGPVVTMIGSVASLVGMGGAPLMSIQDGRGRQGRRAQDTLQLLCHALPVFHTADGGGRPVAPADAALFLAPVPIRCPLRMNTSFTT